jgi:hypothetical protein
VECSRIWEEVKDYEAGFLTEIVFRGRQSAFRSERPHFRWL